MWNAKKKCRKLRVCYVIQSSSIKTQFRMAVLAKSCLLSVEEIYQQRIPWSNSIISQNRILWITIKLFIYRAFEESKGNIALIQKVELTIKKRVYLQIIR